MGGKFSKEEKIKNRISETYSLNKEDLNRLIESLQRRYPSGVVDISTIRNNVRATFYFGSKESMLLEDSIMRIFDKDDDGYVQILEYIETILEIQSMSDREKLEMAFNVFDVDGSGYLERSEIATIIKSLIGKKITSSEKQDAIVNKLINELDVDGDGKIDFGEFVRIGELEPEIESSLRDLFMSTF